MVIKINTDDPWTGEKFYMEINLDSIIRDTGRRELDICDNSYFTVFPVRRARGLLRLIVDYGTEDQIKETGRYLEEHKDENKKVYEIWNKLNIA